MHEDPITYKRNPYPRDFSPPKKPGKADSHPEHLMNADSRFETFTYRDKHTSAQISPHSRQRNGRDTLTVNPQKLSFLLSDQEKEDPLKHHRASRKPYIDLKKLHQPHLEETIHFQVPESEGTDHEPDNEESATQYDIQAPLTVQNLIPLNFHKKTDNQPKTTNVNSFRNPTGSFKSERKGARTTFLDQQTSLSWNQATRRSRLLLKQNVGHQVNDLELGFLLSENKVKQIKQYVNQMALGKSCGKFRNSHRSSPYFLSTQKSKAETDGSPRNGAYSQVSGQRPEENKGNLIQLQDSSLSQPNEITTITYKTSLEALHNISCSFMNEKSANTELQIKVPNILLNFQMDPGASKTELYSKGVEVFEALGIPAKDLAIKRYSNCIVMVTRSVCVIWHYCRKVYLGGWQAMNMGEGVRQGLGLEWVPHKYVYYGQYLNNKKQGLGIEKTLKHTYIGHWKRGLKVSEVLKTKRKNS